tara:strand:+ start:1000 stop:1941 length:942 start_codon:yes stop_codon:yes gene_type:complete
MKQNLNLLIYLNNISENWIVDRTKKEWLQHNKSISTRMSFRSNVIWLIAPWNWRSINFNLLERKKTLCSIYHIDMEKFNDEEKKEFYYRDKFVDEYHVISKNTENQLKKLTEKKITTIPFWVNTKIWYQINEKNYLRNKHNLDADKFYIGSFQRDSEGSDLNKPKLSKGPDRFVEIVSKYMESKKNIHVIITGKRRNYLINEFESRNIEYTYFEMVDYKILNELYNCLDLYIVSSRYEGGPQAIVECGVTKTPIISTDVGVAPEILSSESIFDMDSFLKAKPNIEAAYNNSMELSMEKIFPKYVEMFKLLNES